MKLSQADYALAVIGHRMGPLLRHFGDLETALAARRLGPVTIDRPLFISGLARSGTTILVDRLARAKGVATHRYRDFPFLWAPLTWNWFQDRLAVSQPAVERPHRDRITITRDSPEAFEEPIWQDFFPWVHDPRRVHILDATTRNPAFETFFHDHIRKVLLIRGGTRYLSKGNYNVTRLAYLARLFPDARFVVPVRAPLAHVHSLVKQHRLFTGYAGEDGRVAAYLRAAGHYEFGPQRQPIIVSSEGAERILAAWREGDDYLGYAAQWRDIYGHVDSLTAPESGLAERILVVRYEDFCADPRATLANVLDFAGLAAAGADLLDDLGAISAPPDETADLPAAAREAVSRETATVAPQLGYDA